MFAELIKTSVNETLPQYGIDNDGAKKTTHIHNIFPFTPSFLFLNIISYNGE